MGKVANLAGLLGEDQFDAGTAFEHLTELKRVRQQTRNLSGQIINLVASYKNIVGSAEDDGDRAFYTAAFLNTVEGLVKDMGKLDAASKTILLGLIEPIVAELKK